VNEAERSHLSTSVFRDLARLVHGTAQEVAGILRADGLNPAQLQVLLAVRDAPGTPQHALINRLGTTAANVSMLVSRLEDAGRLRREAVGATNRLWLTEQGAALADRLGAAQEAYMAARFGNLEESPSASERPIPPRAGSTARRSSGRLRASS